MFVRLTESRRCVRTVSHAPRTSVKHRRLRGHGSAYPCCLKSLIGSVLVGFDVRQHARAESISKGAPSSAFRSRVTSSRATARGLAVAAPPRRRTTTRTSLRLESTRCERPDIRLSPSANAASCITLNPAVYGPRHKRPVRGNCVRPRNVLRSLRDAEARARQVRSWARATRLDSRKGIRRLRQSGVFRPCFA